MAAVNAGVREFSFPCLIYGNIRKITYSSLIWRVCKAGLQITAGQRTMSGQKLVLSGQILRWPDNLSGRLRW